MPKTTKIDFDLPGAKSWQDLWKRLGSKGGAFPFFHDLAARYCEESRAYHNMDHVQNVLKELRHGKHLVGRQDELELAVWYHDAIYDTRATDNEERSADFAHVEVARMGLEAGVADRVAELILATRHRAPPRGPDEAVLMDADLAILGYPRVEFDQYCLAIQREYSHVPGAQYATARIAILRSFLDRPRIYFTKCFHNTYETIARGNIQHAIDALSIWVDTDLPK